MHKKILAFYIFSFASITPALGTVLFKVSYPKGFLFTEETFTRENLAFCLPTAAEYQDEFMIHDMALLIRGLNKHLTADFRNENSCLSQMGIKNGEKAEALKNALTAKRREIIEKLTETTNFVLSSGYFSSSHIGCCKGSDDGRCKEIFNNKPCCQNYESFELSCTQLPAVVTRLRDRFPEMFEGVFEH